MQATKMSRSPRFFRSVRQLSQNLAPSVSASHSPSSSLRPSRFTPKRHVNRVLRDAPVRPADMHHDAIEVDDRPNRIQRPRPPGGHFGVQVVGDFGDQRGRNFHAVQLSHDLLDVASRHPLGVKGEDLLVEARHATLVFADQLRLERAVSVARRGDRHFSQFRLAPSSSTGRCGDSAAASAWRPSSKTALPRQSLPRRVHPSRPVPAAPQMDVHLRVEHPLQGRLHHQPHQAIEVLHRLGLAGHLLCQLLRPDRNEASMRQSPMSENGYTKSSYYR